MTTLVNKALQAAAAANPGACPICGEVEPHQHTKAEHAIYRRGVEHARGPEGIAKFEAAVGALADIALAEDLTPEQMSQKAGRVYKEVTAGEPPAELDGSPK